MGKKRLLLIAAALVVILCLGVVVWALLDPVGPEPSYQGKPLSYWLQGYDNSVQMPAPTWQDAAAAVKAIGTNAVPVLMRMLKRKDSKLKAAILELARKQKVLKIHVRPDRLDNFVALDAIRALGPTFSNAVPQLVAFFDKDASPYPQQVVPYILGLIGPAGSPAIPMLLRGIAHTNYMVRNNCVWALGAIHSDPDMVVPALIKCLNDPEPLVAEQAAIALASFGPAARSALPALRRLSAQEPGTGTRSTSPIFPYSSVGYNWASTPRVPPPNVPGAARYAIYKIVMPVDPAPR